MISIHIIHTLYLHIYTPEKNNIYRRSGIHYLLHKKKIPLVRTFSVNELGIFYDCNINFHHKNLLCNMYIKCDKMNTKPSFRHTSFCLLMCVPYRINGSGDGIYIVMCAVNNGPSSYPFTYICCQTVLYTTGVGSMVFAA